MDKNDLFNLCAFIAASAEGLKDEPKDYGPGRLLKMLVRLAELTAKEYNDAFLKEIAEEVDKKRRLASANKEEFYFFLEQLVKRFAEESKNR